MTVEKGSVIESIGSGIQTGGTAQSITGTRGVTMEYGNRVRYVRLAKHKAPSIGNEFEPCQKQVNG